MDHVEAYRTAVRRNHTVRALKLAIQNRQEFEEAGITAQEVLDNLTDHTGNGSFSHGAINGAIDLVSKGWKIPRAWVELAFFSERRFQTGTSILQMVRLHKLAPSLLTLEDLAHPVTRGHIVKWVAVPGQYQNDVEKKAIAAYAKLGLAPTDTEIAMCVAHAS